MAEDREQRISSALSSLIAGLVPPFEGEDVVSFDERQANALELARYLLERCVELTKPWRCINIMSSLLTHILT